MKQSALKCRKQIQLWTRKLNSTKPHWLELSMWLACSRTKKPEPTLANQREEAEGGGCLADEKTLVECYNFFLKLSLSSAFAFVDLVYVFNWWRPALGWNCCKTIHLGLSCPKRTRAQKPSFEDLHRFGLVNWSACPRAGPQEWLMHTMQYNAIPCNTMQYHAIPCNTMQYHAIQCNTMQYHACFTTADGAYHCPDGSIWPFLALSGALIAIPTYYWCTTTFFKFSISAII